MVGMSCGYVLFPADGATAEPLLAEANRRMRQQKQKRRPAAPVVAAEVA
jgi:predicted signal transduction protein with EAL and GGDEF domain